MHTNISFNESYNKNPFWYHYFDLGQFRILRRSQPIVDFDGADNCRLYVTAKKTMNFQDDFPWLTNDNFKAHKILVFVLTSVQNALENSNYPELSGQSLSLELNLTFPLDHVYELSLLGKNESVGLLLTSLVLVEKTSKKDNVFLQQKNQPYPATQVSEPCFISLSFSSDS